jgi:hypothetical protein
MAQLSLLHHASPWPSTVTVTSRISLSPLPSAYPFHILREHQGTMPAGPVARPRTVSRVDLRSQLTFPLRFCFTISTHAGWIRPRTSFGALPILSLPPSRYRPCRPPDIVPAAVFSVGGREFHMLDRLCLCQRTRSGEAKPLRKAWMRLCGA